MESPMNNDHCFIQIVRHGIVLHDVELGTDPVVIGPSSIHDVEWDLDRIIKVSKTASNEVSFEDFASRRVKRQNVELGRVYDFSDYEVRVLVREIKAARASAKIESAEICEWYMQQVTSDSVQTTEMFSTWLSVTSRDVGTRSAFLVMFDERGERIGATLNIDNSEVEKIWGSCPEQLRLEIIRNGAEFVLPQEWSGVQNRSTGRTSIVIKGVQRHVGVAITHRTRLLGIAFFLFANVGRDFTEAAEQKLKFSASLLGLLRSDHDALIGKSDRDTLVAGARRLVGRSVQMHAVYGQIEKLAPTTVSVLIQGETGTGKELLAQEIHRYSLRHEKTFVAFNAAAVPENLAEAEFFGVVRGAFSGAIKDRAGFFELADGGTLFIDEVAELSLSVQAKLLRVLQDGTFSRVGETRKRQSDFRLVCATHRSLETLVREGKFREDLYFRIAGAVVSMPSLRERSEDVKDLLPFLVQEAARELNVPLKTFSPQSVGMLESHCWLGNVRELKNAVCKLLIMSDNPEVVSEDVERILSIKPSVVAGAEAGLPEAEPLEIAKARFLREHLQQALNRNDWNKAAAAKSLGIGLRTLFRYIDDLKIERQL
jgi:DNA-binding NtrC family response regulator